MLELSKCDGDLPKKLTRAHNERVNRLISEVRRLAYNLLYFSSSPDLHSSSFLCLLVFPSHLIFDLSLLPVTESSTAHVCIGTTRSCEG
jgi:hypothetical protein